MLFAFTWEPNWSAGKRFREMSSPASRRWSVRVTPGKTSRMTAVEMRRALEGGLALSRQSRSHMLLRNDAGRRATLPLPARRMLYPQVVHAILRGAELAVGDLLGLLWTCSQRPVEAEASGQHGSGTFVPTPTNPAPSQDSTPSRTPPYPCERRRFK